MNSKINRLTNSMVLVSRVANDSGLKQGLYGDVLKFTIYVPEVIKLAKLISAMCLVDTSLSLLQGVT